MATETLTSATTAIFSQNIAYGPNNTHNRDPSFSSYLSSSEETYVKKLAESKMKPSSTTTSLGRKKNGEISVFGAEKYFNGVMDKEEAIIANKNEQDQLKKDCKVGKDGMKPRTQRGTPSTCSEASWNSRSALLPVMQSRQEKGNGKNFFATLGCKCYCLDNKSVDIDENVSENKKKFFECGDIHGKVMAKLPVEINHDQVGSRQLKQTPPSSWYKKEIPKGSSGRQSEDFFTLTLPNSGLAMESKSTKEEEMARKSLEVFGSPVMDKEDIALSIEKRLAMLTWDANPKVESNQVATVLRSGPNDDTDSDSSSDLFEIKSLSSNGHPFFKRQASDSMSGCMSPSSCYEPSEASIDWSVVTASAANFSVVSDYDETKPVRNVKNNDSQKTTMVTAKNVTKRRPSMLLGCRSQKAVKVAAGAHKLPEKKPEFHKNQKSASFTPRSRFQAESKVTDLDSAQAQRAFAVGPISQLHSARAADPIYMH